MTHDNPSPDVDARVQILASGADLHPIVDVLEGRRDEIVERWLRQAERQPFHADHPERAVADHIPALLTAITAVVRRGADPEAQVDPPLDDEAVARAASAHAQARFEQGLGPVAIATEFRLLRLEISSVLRETLDSETPADDVVSALMVVSDALDGATALALAALTERVETLREELLATTLHDVRQPITIVEGSLVLAARWLERDTIDRQRLSETVDGALLATQEMSLFVDALADASQVAMGSLDLDREPVAAIDIVRDTLAVLPPDERAQVTVIDEVGRGAGDWDRRAVRRVLRNLLSNAVKYSPPQSPVLLRVRADEREIEFLVTDHGIGLDDAELAVLFQRYGRSDSVRAAGYPGLGLGLYACRGLVLAHGGRIWLSSPGRGHGTTAHVVLPVLADTA